MEKKFVHANLFVNVINQVPFSHPSYTQGYIDKIIYFIYNHLSLDIVSSTYTTSAYYKKKPIIYIMRPVLIKFSAL